MDFIRLVADSLGEITCPHCEERFEVDDQRWPEDASDLRHEKTECPSCRGEISIGCVTTIEWFVEE